MRDAADGRVVFRLDDEVVILSAAELPPPSEALVRVAVLEPWPGRAQARTFDRLDFQARAAVIGDDDARSVALARFDEWLTLNRSACDAELSAQKTRVNTPAVAPAKSASVLSISSPLDRLVKRVLQPPAPTCVECTRPELTDGDVSLAIRWLAGEHDVSDLAGWERAGKKKLFDRLDTPRHPRRAWHFGKMMSARRAELAARAFLAQWFGSVEDVSVQQSVASAGDDWKRCDLRVRSSAGEVIEFDVKNARRPWDARSVYTRHIVPRFKDKRDNDEVRILGVLSPYHRPEVELDIAEQRSYDDNDGDLRVLGITSWSRLREIQARAGRVRFVEGGDRGGAAGEISIPRRSAFIPQWAFELPSYMQADRKEALTQLRRYARSDATIWDSLQDTTRLVLASLLPGGEEFADSNPSLSSWEREFVRQLRRNEMVVGLTPPVALITVIGHFVAVLNGQVAADSSYRPSRYAAFLWPGGSVPAAADLEIGVHWQQSRWRPADNPFGAFDYSGATASLIGALDVLWTRAQPEIIRYTDFTITGWQTLRARSRATGQTRTLLTYCGGHSTHGPCGAWPLIGGRERHCERGRLVCPCCEYCCGACPKAIGRASDSGTSARERDRHREL